MPQKSQNPEKAEELVLATLANQKNPAQVVEIVHLPRQALFVTRGIASYFQIKDIAVPQDLMLGKIQEMTGVLSYLLERIATAADLDLPFRYDPEFEVGNRRYTLKESGEYLLLSPGT